LALAAIINFGSKPIGVIVGVHKLEIEPEGTSTSTSTSAAVVVSPFEASTPVSVDLSVDLSVLIQGMVEI